MPNSDFPEMIYRSNDFAHRFTIPVPSQFILHPEHLVIEVSELARQLHGSQTYGNKPYRTHLQQVYELLLLFHPNASFTLKCGAWLHDVLEDTNITYNDLIARLVDIGLDKGDAVKIADISFALTTPKGKTRKERHCDAYYRGIIEAGLDAIIIKLVDRMANTMNSIGLFGDEPSKMLITYRSEYAFFRSKLFFPTSGLPITKKIWEKLDELNVEF